MRSDLGRISLALMISLALLFLLAPGAAWAKPKKTSPAPPPSAPESSFAELLDDAQPVGDLAQLVEPLFDTCDPSDALEYRRCEGSRSFLESQARAATYLATADSAATVLDPADPKNGPARIEVVGCLDCAQPARTDDGHGGRVARIVAVRAPGAMQNGHPTGLELDSTEVPPFRSADAQAKWTRSRKRLRTQFIFRFRGTFSSPRGSGVFIEPLAYRVVDPCTGRVYLISPRVPDGQAIDVAKQVQLAPGDALVCPKPEDDLTPEQRAEEADRARRPDQLSLDDIERAFANVRVRVRECGTEFELSGTVNLVVTVAGPTGRVTEVKVEAPFDKTAAGLCVKAVVKDASFARFKNATQEIKIPVALR